MTASGRDAERDRDREAAPEVSRRSFLGSAGGLAAGGVLAHELLARAAAAAPAAKAAQELEELEGEVALELEINGTTRKLTVEPRTTLLDALRTRLDPPLLGAKPGCERGNCGACTVLVDGEPRYACLQLAVDLRSRAITTVEGLATGDELSPLQAAFVAHDATMCGFCTPGFVVALTACLRASPRADERELREACAGNACRCGTQPQVIEAALAVARKAAETR